MLKAFDFKGKELWARDIQKDYGAFGLNWGYASSPLLHGGDLYVQVLHGMKTDDPSYILRIDGKTGKTVWRQERPTNAIATNRPTPTRRRRSCQYGKSTEIVITGGDVVTGHDPATGKELWRMDGLNPQNNGALPHHRVAARGRRHRHCPDARATHAGDQGRRPRRHHQHPPGVELRQRS